jgi:hypothetical protein
LKSSISGFGSACRTAHRMSADAWKDLRRNVYAAGKNQLQRPYNDLARGGFATGPSGSARIKSTADRALLDLPYRTAQNAAISARSPKAEIHLRTNAKGDPFAFDVTGGEVHEVKGMASLSVLCKTAASSGSKPSTWSVN